MPSSTSSAAASATSASRALRPCEATYRRPPVSMPPRVRRCEDGRVTSLRALPEWQALERHRDAVAGAAPARPLRGRSRDVASGCRAEAAGIYLDYAKQRVTEETVQLLVRLAEARGLPARIEAMFRGEPDQRHRGQARAPRRAADAARGVAGRGRARRRRRTSTRCSTGCAAFADAVRVGSVARAHRPADPCRGQRRHRRLGSRSCDGLRGPSPLQPARPRVPLRLQRGRHRLRRGDPRPRSGGDPVRRLVEDVHDARDDDQRAHRASAGSSTALGDEAAVARHFVAVSTNLDEVAAFGIDPANIVRLLGLGRRPLLDGLGDRAVDDGGHRARGVRRAARRLPRASTSTSGRRRSTRTCRC